MMRAQGETEAEQEVAVESPAVPAEAVDSVPQQQTLHDFVSNLLNDSAARSLFEQDPAGMLDAAGLGDITAEDVQEVIPLVMEYSTLPESVFAQPAESPVNGLESAIEGLRSVAGTAADQSEGLAGTTGLASDAGELGAGGAADLGEASGVLRYVGDSGVGEAAARLSPEGLNLASYSDNALGQTTGMGGVGPESAGGMLSAENPLGSVGGMVDAGLDGVAGDGTLDSEKLDAAVFGGAGEDGLAGGAGVRTDAISAEGATSLDDDVFGAGGAVDTPYGSYGFEMTSEPALSVPQFESTSDVVDSLDADTLSRGSEAAASTLATYMASGGAALQGVVDTATEQLPADLPADVPTELPASTVANPQEDLAAEPALDEQVLTQPRADEAEPTEDESLQIADLSADPPNVVGTVHDVASQLHTNLNSVPEHLGADVPRETPEMPDLPVANPMPSSTDDATRMASDGVESVSDTVSDSPLGDVAETGEDLLSGGASMGDLDLGH